MPLPKPLDQSTSFKALYEPKDDLVPTVPGVFKTPRSCKQSQDRDWSRTALFNQAALATGCLSHTEFVYLRGLSRNVEVHATIIGQVQQTIKALIEHMMLPSMHFK
jgi:hypothetical protein